MRRILLLSLVALLSVASPVYALTPQDSFYVNDYVGILNADKTDYLVRRGAQLRSENGVQVVAVIVDNFIGESMASYANQVFNEFGIGSKNDNNGLLLIVAVDDGEVRIEVGDGLSGLIPDSKAGAILKDYFMPAASEDDLQTAVYRTYLQLIAEGSRLGTGGVPVEPPEPANSSGFWLALVGLLLILFGIAVVVAARQTSRRAGGYPSYPYQGGPNSRPPSQPQRPVGGGYMPVGPIFRGYRPSSTTRPQPPQPSAGGSQPAGGGSSSLFPGRLSRETTKNRSGGGQSSGGGASRGLFGGFGSGRSFGGGGSSGRSSSSGFGGSRSSGGGGRASGGGGRSSGGGAGRGFK